MTDLKPTVSLTSVNSENMSRHQMLDWVNRMVNGHFKKIEDLSSGKIYLLSDDCPEPSNCFLPIGVAYCQMMEMIFPNCINLKRVKMLAKLEHESFHNMKLFQGALTRLKLDKTIPVDRLIKGRFQDNFEFLQWFKKFFDSQAPGMENMKSAANVAEQPKPIKSRPISKPKDVSSDDHLKATMDELEQKTQDVIEKRDRAYEKLRQIEILLAETIGKEEHVDFCNLICDVLYKTTDKDNDHELEQQPEPELDHNAVDDEEEEGDINMGMY
ncbi:hypothetical protein KR044_011181 [Drosophila immigrans]|nr:hypothetical protein KR044_011181 [Drosophila immigrans]